MEEKGKKALYPILGFAGMIVAVVVIRLAWNTLELFIPSVILWILTGAILVAIGEVVWYMKHRKDQEWIKEFNRREEERRADRA